MNQLPKKLKLIFLAPQFPYPPDNGSKARTLLLLKMLSKYCRIDFCSFADWPVNQHDQNQVLPYVNNLKTIIKPVIFAYHKKLWLKFILSIFSNLPFRYLKFYSSEFNHLLVSLQKKNQYDRIYIYRFYMAQYLPALNTNAKKLLDFDTFDSVMFDQKARIEKNLFKKIVFWIESKKMIRQERYYLSRFDRCLYTTDKEKMVLLKYYQPRQITQFLHPFTIKSLYSWHSQSKQILYVGSLYWGANEAGLYWFLTQIWPSLLKKFSRINLKFTIIGPGASPRLLKLFSHYSQITHYPGHYNLEKFYRQASLSISPEISRSGLSVKVLESLGYGVPVVAFESALKDLPDIKQSGIGLSKDKADFIKNVSILLTQPKIAAMQSMAAQAYMKKYFTFFENEKRLRKLISSF